MSFILCLAHHCETHGPTPLMVTEGLPVGCSTCFKDESQGARRTSTSSHSLDPTDGLAGLARSASKENHTASSGQNAKSKSIETPPESPRVAALHSVHSNHKRDSSFRKTYDEDDKRRGAPCENCALTLPRKTNESASPSILENNGPILRTRKPYERVSLPAENLSPPKSYSSSDSDNAGSKRPASHRRQLSRTLTRVPTSSSTSSYSSTSHDHYLDYTSTHEPLLPDSFRTIKKSCVRTLSCETLPPSSTQFTASPTSPLASNHFSSVASASTSGGPIFFGDPDTGYTTAYIFRIPDATSRGRRRLYALMAHSTHTERTAMQTFSYLSAAFRDLAAWMQTLAELELEKCDSPRDVNRNSTPTSSFLSGRRGGYEGGRGLVPKSRGLAEIVGLPDFFIELHARFVRLLIELSVLLRT